VLYTRQYPERMDKYRYTPLNTSTGELRLLELHPGAFDDPISISIITKPFVVRESESPNEDRLERIRESLPRDWIAFKTLEGRTIFWDRKARISTWDHPNPSYEGRANEIESPTIGVSELNFEALSYTWGLDNDQITIQVVLPSCSEEMKTASLTIKENLHQALKHLRDKAKSRILWVDAICINQDDLVERNHQVGRMRDIYTHARRVVVWLGLESSDSTLAMHKIRHIGNQLVYSADNYMLPAPGCTEKDWYTAHDASHIDGDPKTWHAIHRLLLRHWFDRLWVKQEIQLANSSALVQCGADTITWQQLRHAILMCNDLKFPDGTSPKFSAVFTIRQDLAIGFKNRASTKFFRDTMVSKCSDPRDKVFALLGLFPPVLAQHIEPRYDRSASDVYREAFRAFLTCTGSLDILYLSGPSWRPDWSVRRKTLTPRGHFASGDSIADIIHPNPDETMAVGTEYDSIEQVAGPLSADDSSILQEVWNLWLKDATPNSKYPNGEPLAYACAWTLIVGKLRERLPVSGSHSIADAARPFERLQQERMLCPDSNVRLYKSKIIKSGYLFLTSKGYFGVSPIEIVPGDKVCALLGCSAAILMRENSPGKHLFVTCAYVHGLMDGEAFLGPLPEGSKAVVRWDRNGDTYQLFVDSTTQTKTKQDPRLEPLPAEWERALVKDRFWPTKKVDGFRNKDTGQTMDSDPRMLPDALRARGVPLETFTLL
jgi:hypothetical protein